MLEVAREDPDRLTTCIVRWRSRVSKRNGHKKYDDIKKVARLRWSQGSKEDLHTEVDGYRLKCRPRSG